MERPKTRTRSRDVREVIDALARRTAKPVDEVASVYESQLATLRAGAKVDAFLDVLAERRAREILSRH